jgi:PKD repeat protein
VLTTIHGRQPNILSDTTGTNVYVKITQKTSVYLIGQDNYGCEDSSQVLVKVRPLPNLTFNPGNSSICMYDSIPIQVRGAKTYSWTPITGLNSATDSNVISSPISTTTYTVNGTSYYGCKNSNTIRISVDSVPNLTLNISKDSICLGKSTQIQAFGADNYVWSPSTGLNATTGNVVTASPNSTTQYKVVGTNTSGCKDSMYFTIHINPLPNLTINPSNPEICYGESVNLIVNGALTYTWNPLDSLTINNSNASSVAVNPSVNFTYKVIGRSVYGCIDSATKTVLVNPLPNIQFTPSNPRICKYDSVNITVAGGNSYFWSPASGLSSFMGDSVKASPLNTKQYKVTASTVKGCIDSSNIQVIVDPVPDVSIFTQKDTFCAQEDIILKSTGALTYLWSPAKNLNTYVGDSVAGKSYNNIKFKVIGSNSYNCYDSAEKSIIINPLPVLNLYPNQREICRGDSIQIFGFGAFSYNWLPQTFVDNPNNPIIMAFPDSTKQFTMHGTDLNGCSNDTTFSITVNQLPIVNAGNDTTFCNQPIPARLSGIPQFGSWYGNPDLTSNGVFTPNGTGVFKVFYTFTNSNSCTNTDSLNITVNNPVYANAGNDTSICNLTNLQLNGLPYGGFWTGSRYVDSSGIFRAAKDSTFKLYYHYGKGTCYTVDSMNITVFSLPNVYAGRDTFFCNNQTPVLLKTPNPIGGVWKGNGVTNQNTGELDPTSMLPGSYFLTYTFANQNTLCSSSDSIIVTIYPKPNLNLAIDTTYCSNKEISFLNNSHMTDTFIWSFGDGNSDTAFIGKNEYKNDGYYNLKVVEIDNHTCTDTFEKEIEIISKPVADFYSDPKRGCDPQFVNFYNQSQEKYLSYDWIFGNGTTSKLKNPDSILFNRTGNNSTLYYNLLTATNICGQSQHLDTIYIMPIPKPDLLVEPKDGCEPLTVTFRNRSTGDPTNSIWYFGDGGFYQQKSKKDSVTSHTFITKYDDTIYTTRLIVSNVCGQTEKEVKIHVKPLSANAFFTIDKNRICAGEEITIKDFHVGGGSISWNLGDGNLYNDTNLIKHIFNNSGTFKITQIVNNGCSIDTFSAILEVEDPPIVDFETSPNEVCEDHPIDFVNKSQNYAAVRWYFGNGDSSSLQNPIYKYDSGATYNVKLIAYSSSFLQCKDSLLKNVIIHSSPKLDFNINPEEGCVPLTVQINNNSLNTKSYKWNFGDGSFSIDQNPITIYKRDGEYQVKLVANSDRDCKDSLTKLVKVFPNPVADFEMEYNENTAPYLYLHNKSKLADMYQWYWNGQLQSTFENDQIFYRDILDSKIKLIVKTKNNCKDSISKSLAESFYKLFVPNAFMPDETNDSLRFFQAKGIGLKTYKLEIFSNQGNLLYKYETDFMDSESGSPSLFNGWDGTYKGKIMPQDVYLWKISATFKDGSSWEGIEMDGEFFNFGYLMLIR